MNWRRAAPIARTAIGRHLLIYVRSTAAATGHRPEPPSLQPGPTKARQLVFAQSCPFNVKSYPAEFSPSQEAMNPKERVPFAWTVRL